MTNDATADMPLGGSFMEPPQGGLSPPSHPTVHRSTTRQPTLLEAPDLPQRKASVASVVGTKEPFLSPRVWSRPYGTRTGSMSLINRWRAQSSWEHAGEGQVTYVEDHNRAEVKVEEGSDNGSFAAPGVQHGVLNQLQATAIAGNDISSSCFYATGIVAASAGIYAPFCFLIVSVLLYFFRSIYSEVFSALPMNGGTYTALLNTSNKQMAAFAAIFSTLSYTATAVTSAASAGEYLQYGWDVIPADAVAVSVLCFFAFLTILGITESANVAAGLFIVHCVTIFTLIVASIVYVIRDEGSTLAHAWHLTLTEDPISYVFAHPHKELGQCLLFGFSSALLGVTGFESSANYIEEQKPGVFPKTLRNMWIVVSLMNPALGVLAMGVLDISVVAGESKNYVLAEMADVVIGDWFKTVVILDAAVVLAGAVLTSYVGITGMHRRLALDRIMPSVFLQTNKWRGTNHVIILIFLAMTVSLKFMVSDMAVLGGVYAIAFLFVMELFCLSNLLLKFKRGKLRREPIASPVVVVIAMILVGVGLYGNIVGDDRNLKYFLMYSFIFSVVVIITLTRVPVLRIIAKLLPSGRLQKYIRDKVIEIRSFPIVFFTNTASLTTLNKVVQYVIENEETNTIKIVHCFGGATLCDEEAEENEKKFMNHLEHEAAIIDRMYPKLTVEVVYIQAAFTPAAVERIAETLQVPTNNMFITCPGDRFPHNIGHFGGVRVITHGGDTVAPELCHAEAEVDFMAPEVAEARPSRQPSAMVVNTPEAPAAPAPAQAAPAPVAPAPPVDEEY
eukprot:TRINITY_DN36_c6_g1_i1.p1 TRINITY_DN36_c6_g1~~TRINITY_DN36_c6_g1_i1.p1  ORF type:complete len:787 (+),score=309.43 TRINITY_DN36_c6_g1_i1:62-2422(+)